MEWRPRSKTRSGRYQRIVLEETPPRVILQGHETYEDLVNIGKSHFWSPEDAEGCEFTLCNADGTRWSKEDFLLEFPDASAITYAWKRTLFVGRKELDVMCLDDVQLDASEEHPDKCDTCEAGTDEDPENVESEVGESCLSEEHPDESDMCEAGTDEDPENVASEVGESCLSVLFPDADDDDGASIADQGFLSDTSSKKETGRGKENENVGKSAGTGESQGAASQETPTLPALYLPRIPYVDGNAITYNKEDLLGQGAFGTVYMGSFHGTPVAVKKVQFGSAGMAEADIQHEINVSLRLCHPNIVRLMAASRTPSYFLLANEYIHGATLDAVLHMDNCFIKLEGDDAAFISLDLAMAVEYIHAQGVIHQDIKPANVMLHQPSKRAVLTDWGMANIRDTVSIRQGSRLSAQAVGPAGGTFLYMAPECILHFTEATGQTDMWSLGATYLEVLTGSAPWSVCKQRELAMLLRAQTPPHALAQLDPKFSYLGGLLSYDASSRATASEVVTFLKSILDLANRYGYKW
ncbi:mitogen-activated protein kinase kinase kinase NPK1-like isoform X4 [Acanthopagrus latus]|nr:mitogen-activated protein kinase kinase kinase NPK1-like isoform X4 [Acanthopagrus latus]